MVHFCSKNSARGGRSLWLGGIFDYHGLSDYMPLDQTVELFSQNSNTESVELLINDDNVLEPEEMVTVAIYTPGRRIMFCII